MDNIKARYISLGKSKDTEARQLNKSQNDIYKEIEVVAQHLKDIKNAVSGFEVKDDVIDSNIDHSLAELASAALSSQLTDYYMAQLKIALNPFKAHSLVEQSGAALMDRVDRKYLIPLSLLPDLFSKLEPFYTVLTEKQATQFQYKTTYFDSIHDDFFMQHHNGLLNRHKVRIREYVSNEQTFLELKHKNNQFRTHKKRYLLTEQHKGRNINDLLTPLWDKPFPALYKKLLVGYDRISLKHKKQAERITIDINLSFEPLGPHGHELCSQSIPEIAIIELKQEKNNRHTEINPLLKSLKLQEVNFSKYCMGRILSAMSNQLSAMPQTIKYNRFKQCIGQLEKAKTRFYQQASHLNIVEEFKQTITLQNTGKEQALEQVSSYKEPHYDPIR